MNTATQLKPITRHLLATARQTLRREDVIAAIKAALKDRSGRAWSVTGGTGTAWGWIRITARPRDRVSPYGGRGYAEGNLSLTDAVLLGELLGFGRPVHGQGESIPAGHDYYRAYLDRAEGIPPTVQPTPYWD